MNEEFIYTIYLAIMCVVGNTFVACMWLHAFHKNPQAGSAITPVLIACATSEFLALVCIYRLLVG